MKTVV